MSSHRNVLQRKHFILIVNTLNLFLCGGFPFNMAVLNVEFLRVFGESKAQTALVQAVTTGILDIAGIIGGQFVNKYGVRKVGMFGGLLAFLGLALSFFATSILFLVISIGVVAGFGFSLTFLSAFTSVGEYFDGKAKLVAISVIGTGAGCGGMIFPFLMDYLIDMYGWRGCVLIVGGLMGNMVCFFAVCKPKSVGVKQLKPETSYSQDPDTKQLSSVLEPLHQSTDMANSIGIGIPEKQYTCTEKLNSLRKNVTFIIFVLGIALTLSSFGAALIYMLEFLQRKGFGEQDALLFFFLYEHISHAE